MLDAFPKTRALVVDGSAEERLVEYFGVVDYHLSFAREAAQSCSQALYSAVSNGYGLSSDGNELYLINFKLEGVARYGDMAVREASSVVDSALALTNALTRAGIAKRDLRWRSNSKKTSLRSRLELSGETTAPLIRAVDEVWESIGYELLQEYRNWVTHRGAPKCSSPVPMPGPILLPDEVTGPNTDEERRWRIEQYVLTEIISTLTITCSPFYPPVMMIYDADIPEAEEDVILPGGIHIGKGSKNIVIRGARVGSGSLLEKSEDFRTRNQVTPESAKRTIADEELAVYTAMDYVQAVQMVTRFTDKVVTDSWDAALSALLESSDSRSGV